MLNFFNKYEINEIDKALKYALDGEEFALEDAKYESIKRKIELIRKNRVYIKFITSITATLLKIDEINEKLDVGLREICKVTKSSKGAIYLLNDNYLSLEATYAFVKRERLNNKIDLRDGIVGEVAYDKKPILLTNVADENINIQTSLTTSKPTNIYATPLLFENKLIGVLEVASLEDYSDSEIEFFENCSKLFASITVTSQETKKLKESLLKNERQTKELIKQKSEIEQQSQEIEQQFQEIEKQKDEIEEQLKVVQKQKIELAEQNKYKDEFLSNMSHELRTPLNAIILLSSLLIKRGTSKFNQKELDQIETIKASGEDLLELVNNLLDLSKLSANSMPITIEDIDIKTLINQSCKTFIEIAKSKNINLRVDIQYETNITSDSLKIKQILKNLLSNALKFTENGKNINVLVKKAPKPYDVLLEVEDEGIGIPKDKIGKIFEPFKQSDGSTTRKYGGTGLGLALIKEYILLLQGEIKVDSQVGKGTKFSVLLPKEIDLHKIEDEELLDIVSEHEAKKEQTNKSILLIEDNETYINAITEYLSKKNIDIIVAKDGKAGIEYAKELLPDMIILDLNLPKLRGEKVLKELKEDENTKNIPVKILSSRSYDKRIIKIGADSFFQKPGDIEELENVLNEMVGNGVVLFMGNDELSRQNVIDFIKQGRDSLKLVNVKNIEDVHEKLKDENVKLIIVELNNQVIENLKDFQNLKNEVNIIGYSNKELNQDQIRKIKYFIDTIIILTAHSKERFMDEIDKFLHTKKKTIPRSLELDDDLLKNKKILIVDDDERNVLITKDVLENAKCYVAEAYNGKEALQRIKNEKFDAIIIDLMMPDMDGYETITKIKNEFDHFATPILVFSAKAKREKEKNLEVDSYIQKPVDVHILIDELKRLINK